MLLFSSDKNAKTSCLQKPKTKTEKINRKWLQYYTDMGDKSKLFRERSFWGADIQLHSSIFIQIDILFKKIIRIPPFLSHYFIHFSLYIVDGTWAVDALSSSLLLTSLSSLRCFLVFLYLSAHGSLFLFLAVFHISPSCVWPRLNVFHLCLIVPPHQQYLVSSLFANMRMFLA